MTLLAKRELDTYSGILGRGGGGLSERRPRRRRYDYSVADALTEEQRPKSRFAAIEQQTAAWEGGGEGADGAEGAQAEGAAATDAAARVQLVARTLLAQDKAQCVSAEGWQNSVLPAFAMMGVG